MKYVIIILALLSALAAMASLWSLVIESFKVKEWECFFLSLAIALMALAVFAMFFDIIFLHYWIKPWPSL